MQGNGVVQKSLRLERAGPTYYDGGHQDRAGQRLNQGLMVREVADLASGRRSGIMMMPEAGRGDEKKKGDGQAGGDAPAGVRLGLARDR